MAAPRIELGPPLPSNFACPQPDVISEFDVREVVPVHHAAQTCSGHLQGYDRILTGIIHILQSQPISRQKSDRASLLVVPVSVEKFYPDS